MPSYQTKPETINAVRFNSLISIAEMIALWPNFECRVYGHYSAPDGNRVPAIDVKANGRTRVTFSDWVVEDCGGRFKVYTDQEFNALFDRAA